MITIREAAIDDYEEIHKLNQTGLGYDYPLDKTKEKLRLILDMPTEKLFVAEFYGSIAGYIHLSAYECTYADSLKNVLALVVGEGYRKKGVGSMLMEKAEVWAKETGSKGIRLVSGLERTEAHQFYINCGFKYRKEQKNFIKWL